MPLRRVLALAAAVALGLAACTTAPPPAAAPAAPVADAPDDIAAIKAAREAFMAGYEAGDAAAIGELYAPNAVSESNHQPSLEGRDAIVASLQAMFEQVGVKATLQSAETRTLGHVGLDRGTYSVTVTPKAGATPTTSEGRYMVVYVKQDDGKWRVFRDMDNGLMPPAAPVAATPATMPAVAQ